MPAEPLRDSPVRFKPQTYTVNVVDESSESPNKSNSINIGVSGGTKVAESLPMATLIETREPVEVDEPKIGCTKVATSLPVLIEDAIAAGEELNHQNPLNGEDSNTPSRAQTLLYNPVLSQKKILRHQAEYQNRYKTPKK